MITKEQIEQAANNMGYNYALKKAGFEDGALWALAQLDPICNDAATLIEQFKRDFTVIPGTSAAIYWPGIDEKYKWVAVDLSGYVFAFMSKPELSDNDYWLSPRPCISVLFIETQNGVEDWQELIFERPE